MSDGWHWLLVGNFAGLVFRTPIHDLSRWLLVFLTAWWLGSKGISRETTGQKLYHLLWPNLGSHPTYFSHITFTKAITKASPIPREGKRDYTSGLGIAKVLVEHVEAKILQKCNLPYTWRKDKAQVWLRGRFGKEHRHILQNESVCRRSWWLFFSTSFWDNNVWPTVLLWLDPCQIYFFFVQTILKKPLMFATLIFGVLIWPETFTHKLICFLCCLLGWPFSWQHGLPKTALL